jgi:hypothetical protein
MIIPRVRRYHRGDFRLRDRLKGTRLDQCNRPGDEADVNSRNVIWSSGKFHNQ